MNKNNINTEIDLYSIAVIIFKNKIKLFMIVIIGIIVAIVHEINEKPFTPIYEISTQFEEISILNQQEYDELNKNILLTNNFFSTYLQDFVTRLNLENMKNDQLNYFLNKLSENNTNINKLFNIEKSNSNYELIDSKLLLTLFVRFLLEELESTNNKEKIKNIEIVETPTGKSKIGNFRDSSVQIKFSSNDGDLETWEEFFQNQYKKINENVRIFLLNKLTKDNSNLKKNYNYYLENIYSLIPFNEELINVSNKIYDRQLNFLGSSPLSDSNRFLSSKFYNNSVKIKIVNESQKNIKVEIKILISIIISLIVGVILISLVSALKKPQ